MSKNGFVYILASKPHGVLYIGVTNNLTKRVYDHKHLKIQGFSKSYNVTQLVYFERFDDISEAILREKRMKKWKRDWKVKLIEQDNPNWEDLWENINTP